MNPVMPKQEYLRPHDVCVLLQLAVRPWGTFRDLSAAVGLSLGETHNSAKRLELARLAAPGVSQVNVEGALEFLSFGVPYVFPAQLGAPARGVPTAFSAPPLANEIVGDESRVWPSPNGPARGVSLLPLCPSATVIWEKNPELYTLLTLVDAVRTGRARERRMARAHLEHALSSSERTWADR